ncbi:MAG: hypothetical protein AAFS00_15995 [Bacteroidota bacterium]
MRDRMMMRDLVFQYKLPGKTLVFHDTFGDTLRDTRFVTKRLSVLFSEAMVYNNAFTAEQRGIMSWDGTSWEIDTDRIQHLIEHIQVIVIGPVIAGANGPELVADPLSMVEAAKAAFGAEDIFLFPDNPLTPLGQKKPLIANRDDYQSYLQSYEEEKRVLDHALRLAPAHIALPTNYSV